MVNTFLYAQNPLTTTTTTMTNLNLFHGKLSTFQQTLEMQVLVLWPQGAFSGLSQAGVEDPPFSCKEHIPSFSTCPGSPLSIFVFILESSFLSSLWRWGSEKVSVFSKEISQIFPIYLLDNTLSLTMILNIF